MKKRFEVSAARKCDVRVSSQETHRWEWVNERRNSGWMGMRWCRQRAEERAHTHYQTRRQQPLKNDTQIKFLRFFFSRRAWGAHALVGRPDSMCCKRCAQNAKNKWNKRLCTSYAIIDFCDWLSLPPFLSLKHIENCPTETRQSAKSAQYGFRRTQFHFRWPSF